ncbi:MAG TPA: hypothetical protein VL119_05200, partial [Acidimicrobiia bacterium]|nr:hypothetical protein [Acidimicrobiia bacterium]
MMKNLSWPLLAGILLATACQGGESTSTSGAEPQGGADTSLVPGTISVGPERDANLVQHAVLAFRAQDDALVGGYRTQQVSIRDGIVAVTPYTFLSGERQGHAAMTFETTSVTIDGSLIASAAEPARLDDGAVVIPRGPVEERLFNQPEGVHQEWHFANDPDTTGDLAIEIAISGYAYKTTTQQGLHFVSADGTAGLRYGNAVWSGADGAEWPITATYDHGRIRLVVPESVVSRTTFPAVLDPTISSETAVDSIVVGPTGANQQQSSIAFGGGEYLVVWSDQRDSTDADIWGTRLSSTGTILDPLGIKVVATPGVQSNPAVTYNGSTFVVAWEDFKVTGGTDADIHAATVSTAGAVGTPVAVATTTTSERFPVIAAQTGGNALLVWNAAGTVMGSSFDGSSFGAPFTIASGTTVEHAGVASNPAGNYLVSFTVSSHVQGQLVTSAGALSGSAFAISSTTVGTANQSAATFDGTNYDVVWVNSKGGNFVYGARVSTAGTVLDVGGVALNGTPANSSVPQISCMSSGCVVVWQDRRAVTTNGYDLYAQLVTTSMTQSGSPFALSNVNGNQELPTVANNGTGFFGTWTDTRDNYANQAFGATISSAGAVGTAGPIGTGNNRESSPALGRASGTFGLFWTDSRVFSNDILYVRFSASGPKLDSNALTASSATYAQTNPAATTD